LGVDARGSNGELRDADTVYWEAIDALGKIQNETERAARKERIQRFRDTLRKTDGLLAEFDETLWRAMADSVAVHAATETTFTFRDGGETQVDIRRK
jgi:hypothetical protein